MDSGASTDSQPSSFTISGLTKFRLPLLLLFCLSGCLPTDGCFAAPGPRERGATRITLLATSEEEEEDEALQRRILIFEGPTQKERIANEDKQLQSEWAIAIAEM